MVSPCFSHEEPDPAAEGGAADAHRARVTEARGQPVDRRRGAVLRRGEARRGHGDAPLRVDRQVLGLAQVEDHAPFDAAMPGVRVPAPAHREGHPRLAREPHEPRDVVRIRDPDDGRGTSVDGARPVDGWRLAVGRPMSAKGCPRPYPVEPTRAEKPATRAEEE